MSNPKKKLFTSCPMKGRTEEAIQHDMDRMHKMAEIVFDQELEVIHTVIENDPPKGVNWSIWYLGESIKKMAEADYFIGVCVDGFHGCEVEGHVARAYDIPSTYLPREALMSDVIELERANANCCTFTGCPQTPLC